MVRYGNGYLPIQGFAVLAEVDDPLSDPFDDLLSPPLVIARISEKREG